MTTTESAWTKTRREIGMVDRIVYRLLPAWTTPDQDGDYWTIYKWNTAWCIDAPAPWGRFTETFSTLRDAKEFVEHQLRVEASEADAARRAADAIAASDAAALAAPIDAPTTPEPQESAVTFDADDDFWSRETRLRTLARRVAAIEQLENGLGRTVHHARAAGASWAEIGTALGVSLQAAHKRYAEHPAASAAMRDAVAGRAVPESLDWKKY